MENKKYKTWKRKDGRPCYSLPNCKVCGKRSNTTDKETSQIAHRIGRICQDCTKKGNFNLGEPKIKPSEPMDKDVKGIMFPEQKKSIWQRILEWFR